MLIHGDARAIPMADESVQCVVTSPPYWGLRDYGLPALEWADGWRGVLGLEPTPELWLQHIVECFREVKRVLREDGTCWVNVGDAYQSKQLLGLPWRMAFALQADGWYLRADVIWAKPNPMPESVSDRPTKAHEYLFLLAKSERYFYDAEAVREPLQETTLERGYAYRDREYVGPKMLAAADDVRAKHDWHGKRYIPAGRNRRSVWTIATEPYPEAHFATFPEALVTPCVLASTRTHDLVLDPFGGSGTVGAVAERLGRRWVAVDLKPEYLAMAKRRTAQRGFAFLEGTNGNGHHRHVELAGAL